MASNGTYTSNQAFDPLGNVTAGSQFTASKLYAFGYTYNLAGGADIGDAALGPQTHVWL
ncbi:MAG TPA: hypothetical protein VN737_15680 [Bryobacteraceae bacterium]|nr:hypothetical protein [Bryobacteraceae bacterium]